MSKNKWVRSISFNRTNPDDMARLRLIGKKSFSRYIKSLLDAEIKRQSALPPDTTKTDTPQPPQRVIAPGNSRIVTPRQQGTQGKPKLINPMLRKR